MQSIPIKSENFWTIVNVCVCVCNKTNCSVVNSCQSWYSHDTSAIIICQNIFMFIHQQRFHINAELKWSLSVVHHSLSKLYLLFFISSFSQAFENSLKHSADLITAGVLTDHFQILKQHIIVQFYSFHLETSVSLSCLCAQSSLQDSKLHGLCSYSCFNTYWTTRNFDKNQTVSSSCELVLFWGESGKKSVKCVYQSYFLKRNSFQSVYKIFL